MKKKEKDFNRSSILCNIKAPFELLHADVAHIHFFQNQQLIQLMFYLLLIYSLLKKRTLLSKKLEIFYKHIEQKREKVGNKEKMRIHTDLDFQQNEITDLMRNIILKCFVEILEVEKHLQLNKK